jgi:hypothetical protein
VASLALNFAGCTRLVGPPLNLSDCRFMLGDQGVT